MTVALLNKRVSRGVTILEVVVVIVIIAILASLLFPAFIQHRARAEEVKCLANLRSLYVAATGYLQAGSSWPQIPAQLVTTDPETFARNWVEALAPYGAPHVVWICPSIQTGLGISMDALESPDVEYRIDYMPISFDDNPASPWRWQKYPWFVEKGSPHSRGNLMIYGDGTELSLRDLALGAQ